MAIHHRKLFLPCFDFPETHPPRPPPPPPTLVGGNPPAQTHEVPILMFSVLGLLLLFLLRFLFYISKCHSSMNSYSARRNSPGFEDDYYGGQIRGLGPDNSGWQQVRTAGLEQSVIDSIPVFEFRSADRLVEAAECSICLKEFEEDEALRLLPKCCHSFHRPCIDTWLRSHHNCPLCRAPIVLENTPLKGAEPGSNGPAAREALETESLENNGGTRGRRVGEIEEERKDLQRSSKRKRQLRVRSDLAGRLTKPEQESQPVRRSISMDASSASRTQPTMASIPPAGLEGCSSSQ
ncbi:E3 ubiquitin-protein ligase RING1-like [Diospyros lotus]|uniref:E3 ubiquitin-protein ligase RING1-like n=1 Tax=Diospyros lotus TaxID=55363 RepID=UPI00225BFE97|nr:E3 ubiquitin-protein ligase RING1-like [Diospyros lotus]